jgi:hypothetical protein
MFSSLWEEIMISHMLDKKDYKYKMTNKDMKRGLHEIFLLFFILAVAVLAIENVSAVACTLQGEVFNIDSSAAALGTNVNCTNLATGLNYTTTTGTGFPGALQYYNDFKCTMSCNSVGGSGDTVRAKAYNATHFGINATAMTASTTYINVTMNSTFPVADITPPTYWNESKPTDPSVYNTGPYKFNITWSDNVAIGDVILTFDNQNYSYKSGDVQKITEESGIGITGAAIGAPSNIFSQIYSSIKDFFLSFFRLTGFAINGEITAESGVYSKTFTTLGVGVHNYTWWANDTSNLQNSTGLLTFNITQAANPVTLTLGGSPANRTITYLTSSNAAASASSGNACLYRDSSLLSCGANPSENIVLANETYIYFANSTGNQNYSVNSTGMAFALFVNKAISSCTLTASSVTYPNPVTASCSCNNAEAAANLYRDNVLANSENTVPTVLAAGGYTYFCNVTSTQNYTNSSKVSSITISQGNPSSYMHLFINGIEDNSSNILGAASNITAYSTLTQGAGDIIYNLYNNSILVMNGNPAISMPILPAGDYDYIYNTSGGTNWTLGTTALRNLNISDNPPPTFNNLIALPANAVYSLGQNYYFNVTVYDIHGVSSALIEHNFTGTSHNYTVGSRTISSTQKEFYYTYQNLAAGNYYFMWHANDTLGMPGSTSQQIYTVNKSASQITLTLNSTESNFTLKRGKTVNITATLNVPSSGSIILYLNNSLINSGVSPLANITDMNNITGNYNVTALYPQTQNYSSSLKTYFVNVSASAPSITIVNPLNSASLGAGTTETYVNITTDEKSICRYNLTNSTFSFANGINFTNTNDIAHSFLFANMSNGQTYTLYYKCNNSFGDISDTTTHTFSVSSPSQPSGGGGGTKGGGGGGAPAAIPASMPAPVITYNLEEIQNYTQYLPVSIIVPVNAILTFTIRTAAGYENHTIVVTSINTVNKTASLLISSQQFNLTIELNKRTLIDVNKDGIDDIAITLTGFVDSTSNLTLQILAYCGNAICEPGETQENCCSDCGCPANQECKANKCAEITKPSPTLLDSLAQYKIIILLGAAAIVILVVIIVLLIRAKHKGHKHKHKPTRRIKRKFRIKRRR